MLEQMFPNSQTESTFVEGGVVLLPEEGSQRALASANDVSICFDRRKGSVRAESVN